jgi:hypothetical protein
MGLIYFKSNGAKNIPINQSFLAQKTKSKTRKQSKTLTKSDKTKLLLTKLTKNQISQMWKSV